MPRLALLLVPLALFPLLPAFIQGAAPPKLYSDVPGYSTVETAIKAKAGKAAAGPGQTGYLGVQLAGGKATVAEIDPDSAAARAGLRPGDALLKVAGEAIADANDLRRALAVKRAGSVVELVLSRGGQEVVTKAALTGAAPAEEGEREGKGWDLTKGGGKGMRMWTKSVYRLAIILIDYPDAKSNPKITPKDWEDSAFSTGTYTGRSCTGQKVHGSMNDHFLEQSYGKFRIEGKAIPHVLVSKKRAEYGKQGTSRQALLTEALDAVLKRDGPKALDGFDGVFFMYSGGRMQVARGSLYWPHRSSVRHQGKSWPYFICPEGGETMYNISVLSHEFGHMLGLPDLYARPENPGSEGLDRWCLMSNQTPAGKPQHMSAWCKERLGWITPTTIDPSVPQKLVLAPIYKSPRECYKVLARPDGSEHFLLENRGGVGFDASLPASGLLIWRVTRGRPLLEESHGIAGPAGPRSFPNMVPYPSKSNDAFTPFTVPSSRAQLGGGTPVHITNIRRLPDGRITFMIGYEFF